MIGDTGFSIVVSLVPGKGSATGGAIVCDGVRRIVGGVMDQALAKRLYQAAAGISIRIESKGRLVSSMSSAEVELCTGALAIATAVPVIWNRLQGSGLRVFAKSMGIDLFACGSQPTSALPGTIILLGGEYKAPTDYTAIKLLGNQRYARGTLLRADTVHQASLLLAEAAGIRDNSDCTYASPYESSVMRSVIAMRNRQSRVTAQFPVVTKDGSYKNTVQMEYEGTSSAAGATEILCTTTVMDDAARRDIENLVAVCCPMARQFTLTYTGLNSNWRLSGGSYTLAASLALLGMQQVTTTIEITGEIAIVTPSTLDPLVFPIGELPDKLKLLHESGGMIMFPRPNMELNDGVDKIVTQIVGDFARVGDLLSTGEIRGKAVAVRSLVEALIIACHICA